MIYDEIRDGEQFRCIGGQGVLVKRGNRAYYLSPDNLDGVEYTPEDDELVEIDMSKQYQTWGWESRP